MIVYKNGLGRDRYLGEKVSEIEERMTISKTVERLSEWKVKYLYIQHDINISV